MTPIQTARASTPSPEQIRFRPMAARRSTITGSGSAAPPESSLRSELAAELAVERVGTAAAQSDGGDDQGPEQRIFPTAALPVPRKVLEARSPVRVEDDQQELDADRCREDPREQPEYDAERAHGLEKEHRVGERHRRLDAAPRQAVRRETRNRVQRQLLDAV